MESKTHTCLRAAFASAASVDSITGTEVGVEAGREPDRRLGVDVRDNSSGKTLEAELYQEQHFGIHADCTEFSVPNSQHPTEVR